MSLVNHLKLDETSGNFADSVGSLVGVRDPAGWVSSVPGFLEPGDRCPIFSLGGSYASRILCGDTIWEGSGDQSITCWFRFFGLASTSYFFNKPSSFSMYFLDANNVRFIVLGSSGINENILINATPLETAGWHHVAVVKRGSVYEAWIDGILVFSKFGPSSLVSNTENFAIGNHGGGSAITYGNDVYTGVNDFKYWDHALFESELVALAWGEVDTTAPYLDNLNPVSDEIEVPVGDDIYLEIKDASSDVDNTTIEIYVDLGSGYQKAYDYSGGFYPGFDGSSSSIIEDATGNKYYKVTIDPTTNFTEGNSIIVRVIADDSEGNSLDTTYQFKAADYPFIGALSPAPGFGYADANTPISFVLDDGTSGVDNTTIDASIDGVDAIINGVFQSGYVGSIVSISSTAYRITIQPLSNLSAGDRSVSVYCEDQYANPFSYTYSFTVKYKVTGRKQFVIGKSISEIGSVSSYFKPSIGNVRAGSKGNTSLNVESDDIAAVGTDYEIRTVTAGRFDTKLNAVRESVEQLGSGQLEFTDETTFKGSFTPPEVVVDDGTNVFGIDRTFSKLIHSTYDAGYTVTDISLCDRNDESLFVLFLDSDGTKDTLITSVPKLGKTDSNPVTRIDVSGIDPDTAVRIDDNKYLIAQAFDSSPERIEFTVIDENCAVLETLNPFYLPELVNGDGPNNLDMYADMQGNVYIVFDYNLDGNGRNTTVGFLISNDNGNNWRWAYEPGTNTFSNIGDPLSEVGFDPTHVTYGVGYSNPRIHYDTVNDQFVLTVQGGQTTGAPSIGMRFVTLYSDDFLTWRRLNFPVFKENVAETANADTSIVSTYPIRMVRFGGKYFGIQSNITSGQFACLFQDENDLYGMRRGAFWVETVGASGNGARIYRSDVKEVDGILYLASSFYGGGYLTGYAIHVLGSPTNLPDRTQYSCAYIGTTADADPEYGWTKNSSGSPTYVVGDDGLTITAASGETAYYSRTDKDASEHRFKNKFIIKPVTDSGVATSTCQMSQYFIRTTDANYKCNVRVIVGSDGVRIVDLNGATDITHATSITDFVEVMFAFEGTSATTGKVRVYLNDGYAKNQDEWEQIADFTATGVYNVANQYIYFGLPLTTTGASVAIWKAFYYADLTDNNDIAFTIEDELTTYSSPADEAELDPLPLKEEGVPHLTIDNLMLTWRGTDAFEGDKWNFSSTTDFGAINAMSKVPCYVWRSGFDTASGLPGAPSDQTILLDADDNEIGMFVFDTAIFYNTNTRYIRLQANDTDVWTSPSVDETVDFTKETGTIDGDWIRNDSDLLNIRCTDKEWDPGELAGHYIMLEEIYEEHKTTPANDNHYRNVAFKILDNGFDNIIISTKGLVADELGTDVPANYDPMKVLDGDDFVIYYNRMSHNIADLKAYKYVRVLVTESELYSDSWGASNQPNLPNERSWQIGEFDVGERIELTDDTDYGYTEEDNANVNVTKEDDGRSTIVRKGQSAKKFTLKYGLNEDRDNEILDRLFNSISETDNPFWYITDYDENPAAVYLVTSLTGLSSSRFLPERQNDSIVLEEITC